jgi:glycosyltransferase involved in cell wall biosynthesis
MNPIPNLQTNEPAVKASPKVSVLIPVYNSERYLAECLDSILAQDFRDYEILIADDGSTDNSRELIKAYAAKDARIRWWQNPQNLGLTQNHNACLREARGEFIKFVHQDDTFLQPSVLARMVEILQQDATVSLVGTGSNLIDEQGRVLAVRNNFHHTGTRDGKDTIVTCMETNQNLIGEPTAVMFRKSQAGRGLDERYRQIVDMEFWFHLLEQGRFAYLAEPLFAYRVHPQQATETHKRTGVSDDEHLQLFIDYFRRPWLKTHATREMWFRQIYHLRKNYGERARGPTAEAMPKIKLSWYALYWLRRKAVNPFTKIKKHLRRLVAN